ncbi:immunoglobulin-like domain-containing protein [Aquimarina sp. 433]
MKKTFQYTITALVFIFVLFACNKEITEDLLVFFKVEFNETTFDAFVNTEEETTFTIVGIDNIAAGDYQIKYDVTEGSGSYFLNDTEISENEFVDLPAGPEFTIEYVGTLVGVNKVTVTLRDAQEREEEFVLTYNVNDTDFTFDVAPSSETTYVSGEIDLDLSIAEISSATYEIAYTFISPSDITTEGAGTISVDDTDLEPDTSRAISVGDSRWQFTGVALGTVDVEFTVTSSLGVSKSQLLNIVVGETPDFTFTATLVDSTNPIFTTDSGAAINFNITETAGTSSYVMNYSSSNTGNLVYNGETFEPGDNISIQVGESIGTYVGTLEGEHILDFQVDNSNTVTVSREASLTLTYRDPDGTPPTIELVGAAEITINIGEAFVDPGATASDDIDGDLTANITVAGSVDVNVPGTYTLVYSVQDSSGNTSTVDRIVNVIDNIDPVITLLGDNPLTALQGETFNDPGATATDNVDGDISSQIQVTGMVNTNVTGAYELTYTVSDTAGNQVSATRTVNVISDNPPVITLVGSNPLEVSFGATFLDPGATATDDLDGDLTDQIQVSGAVDVTILGSYTLVYSVTDSSGNNVEVTRTVNVIDNTSPVITLEGANPFIVNVGNTFTDPGANANDNVDGNITANITVSGSVDVNTPGDYVLTYSVTDSSNNTATITRTVRVIDNVAPVITLVGASTITVQQGGSFTDPGATASDNVDGNITASIQTTGNVNVNLPGSYTIRYNVQDAAGNSATEVTRTVIVESNINFNRATGVLTAPAGSTVELSMNSGGDGSGRAEIRATSSGGANLGIAITCWSVAPGGIVCIDVDGDGENDTSGFTFTMPADGVANFTGSHEPNSGSTGSGTSFSIRVAGETFNGSMTSTNGIPQ